MTRTDKEFEEIDELNEMLEHLRGVILKSGFDNTRVNRSLEAIHLIREKIWNFRLRNLSKEYLWPLLLQYKNEGFNVKDREDLDFIFERLDSLADILIDYHHHHLSSGTVNSEEYYTKKINELKASEAELNQFLRLNQNETEEQKKEIEETKERLGLIQNELDRKKKELAAKEKQEDAKNDWELRIKESFNDLKEYLKPIENEKFRLNFLFYTYAALCLITLVLIVIAEINLIDKIAEAEKLPKLNEYILILLPLPIAGALMWGFIFQMNRAQRQLISISNNIHSVKYIQGLLLTINNLSPDINDSVLRVNSALDKIISNHLNDKVISDEEDQIKVEGKDKVEIENLLKLISAVK